MSLLNFFKDTREQVTYVIPLDDSKKEDEKQTVMHATLVETAPVKKMSIVEEIHHAFFTQSDGLLSKLEKELSELRSLSYPKAERMRRLGFIRCKEVMDDESNERRIFWKQLEYDRVKYYKTKYPLYKHISDQHVTFLCDKYKLELGSVGAYKGDIPEKNLSEIENFKMNIEDMDLTTVSEEISSGKIIYDGGERAENYGLSFKRVDVPSLFICAPYEDMETGRWDRSGKDVDDPIVLQRLPNRAGYLIVTAWGEEASDPVVVNEINN